MSFEAKARLLSVVIFAGLLLVFLRLAYWQTIKSGGLAAAADNQHFYFLGIPAQRGEIRSADGAALAANKIAYLLYAHLPELSSNKSSLQSSPATPDAGLKKLIADQLAEILSTQVPIIASDSAKLADGEIDKLRQITKSNLGKYFLERLNLQNAGWVNLYHFVTAENHDKIANLKIPGIGFEDEQTRDYPEASMAAHTLGFVGADQNGNPKGYFGLEGYYQREIAGKAGEVRLEKDAFGRPIAIGSEERQEKQDGRNLITTIDRSVQHFVESNLEKGITDWKATGGTAVVMDPKTGAIVALASLPRYHPGDFAYYPTKLYKNPAIADLFEPGSIIKPLVMSAAINENKLTPETRCDKCDGPRQIYDFYIHTFDNHYHSNETMTDVLVNSDNTGMVFVGEKLGFKGLYSYFQRFGFGKRTGVDLEEEEEGSLRNINDYYPIDQATMTFGQGISVNVLQMVRGYGALANRGILPTPYLVSQIQGNGQTITLPHKPGPQVISESTARTVTEMLVQVANKSPEHFPKDRIPELSNFRIAAKSGTAQIAVGGKYKPSGTIASVIGYFPADDPKFVVYVKLNEPEVRPWGSDTAGPVFFSIIRDLISHYGISP